MKHEFPEFHLARVAVIGDLMLDRFYFGKASRISPEAPVPVVNVQRLEDVPGGAGKRRNEHRFAGGLSESDRHYRSG